VEGTVYMTEETVRTRAAGRSTLLLEVLSKRCHCRRSGQNICAVVP
jgi:hypothetical protein